MKVYVEVEVQLCILDTGTRWSGQFTVLAPFLLENQPPLPTNWIGFSLGFKEDGFHFKTFWLSHMFPSLH